MSYDVLDSILFSFCSQLDIILFRLMNDNNWNIDVVVRNCDNNRPSNDVVFKF